MVSSNSASVGTKPGLLTNLEQKKEADISKYVRDNAICVACVQLTRLQVSQCINAYTTNSIQYDEHYMLDRCRTVCCLSTISGSVDCIGTRWM